jgi:hypothetical protein
MKAEAVKAPPESFSQDLKKTNKANLCDLRALAVQIK